MKKLHIIACTCAALLLFAACGDSVLQDTASPPASEPSAGSGEIPAAAEPASPLEITKDFGSYSIPEGWQASDELSTDELFFYLKEGTSLDAPTTNISVSAHESSYGIQQLQEFAQAIDRQLKAQVTPDVTEYYGGGTYTENDYPLITMTIGTEDARTVQYYIIGDYRFVMVHLTDFGDEDIPDAEEAARTIVDSFIWEE